MKIIPCKNGVGDWEIDPIHETFDTYAEAEKRMLELKNETKIEDTYSMNIVEAYKNFSVQELNQMLVKANEDFDNAVKEVRESGLRSKQDRVETCSIKIECLNFVIAIRKADELLSTLEGKR